ncbi:MAG: hypothetical protein K2W78_13015 [Xanthobacteraceae bacterium]|nr:hypothetical protein [Xanthobacteraceae bacterium]
MSRENSVTTRKKPQQFQQALQREFDKFEAQERQLSKRERQERAEDLVLPESRIEQLKSSLH